METSSFAFAPTVFTRATTSGKLVAVRPSAPEVCKYTGAPTADPVVSSVEGMMVPFTAYQIGRVETAWSYIAMPTASSCRFPVPEAVNGATVKASYFPLSAPL
ncbi:hypothetical protein D3C87_1664160 [compost metagenome]